MAASSALVLHVQCLVSRVLGPVCGLTVFWLQCPASCLQCPVSSACVQCPVLCPCAWGPVSCVLSLVSFLCLVSSAFSFFLFFLNFSCYLVFYRVFLICSFVFSLVVMSFCVFSVCSAFVSLVLSCSTPWCSLFQCVSVLFICLHRPVFVMFRLRARVVHTCRVPEGDVMTCPLSVSGRHCAVRRVCELPRHTLVVVTRRFCLSS